MKVLLQVSTVALLLQAETQGFVPSSRTRHEISRQISATQGFVPSNRTRHEISRQISATQLQHHSADRREWIADAARILVGGGGILSLPSSSNAATLAATEIKTEFPPSLCDPSISTWKNPANNRVVHILGTAHISEASAELAGVLVKDVRPNAVFVELDRKRISRAMPKGSGRPMMAPALLRLHRRLRMQKSRRSWPMDPMQWPLLLRVDQMQLQLPNRAIPLPSRNECSTPERKW